MSGRIALMPIGVAVSRDANSGGGVVTGFSCDTLTGSTIGHIPQASGVKPASHCTMEASGSSPNVVVVHGAHAYNPVEWFQLGAQTRSVPTTTGGGRPPVSRDCSYCPRSADSIASAGQEPCVGIPTPEYSSVGPVTVAKS